jgi:hypothetical protein
MLRGFLFGAGTVKPETVHAKTWTIHGKCFAKVHGVKELTPAMIALASVLVRPFKEQPFLSYISNHSFLGCLLE